MIFGKILVLNKESLSRPNFSYKEFFVSDTAKKMGISNYPPKSLEQSILPALMSNADRMQDIRLLINKPIKINSAYRCPELNNAVGSTNRSQHLQGLACDFICPEFGTPEEIVKYLHSINFPADQCFNEGSWVHYSCKMNHDGNRMMYGYYLLEDGSRKFKPL